MAKTSSLMFGISDRFCCNDSLQSCSFAFLSN